MPTGILEPGPLRGRLCYIGLGSNLGDRQVNLRLALEHMAQFEDLRILQVSSFYETEPLGFESSHLFLNAVAEVEWAGQQEPLALLRALQHVETALGRPARDPVAEEPGAALYEDRLIDLDIIWLEGVRVSSPQLCLPHPRAKDRDFVLVPLSELNVELAQELRES